jgi:mannose-6-phosphate isomerase-like protein (cupin superfamily)
VLSGIGQLWRKTGDVEDVTELLPHRCVSIPPGIHYQYRAGNTDLVLLVATAPRWKRENWAAAGSGCWDSDGRAISKYEPRPGPWVTVDLAERYDYLAPDGSEIRLLPTYDNGGLAHCRLAAGRTSRAVRHRTVQEVRYVLAGKGQVWRARDADEEVVDVETDTGLTIPTGVSFQFRAGSSSPLEILIGTFPRWPGQDEAEPVGGYWDSHS